MDTRNAMSMVNIAIAREYGELFHFDGEFNSMEDLVRGTFTGRNLGWYPNEKQKAIKHIAEVIRQDDGKGELAQEFGGSYRKVLKGTAKDLPAELRLPAEYRLDVDEASDQQILAAVAKLVAAYVRDLNFARDDQGNYTGSPYDRFLAKNKLPRQPASGEPLRDYSQRLLRAVDALSRPKFVSEADGRFETHQQAFVFGKKELAGMKLFFRQGTANTRGGNCVSCHTAPHFSDFSFHNTGLTQHDYDSVHGAGAFMKLAVPDLQARNNDYDRYLPATAQHPHASGRFRSLMAEDKPGVTDLGLWNVFANPDMPAPQAKLRKHLCDQAGKRGIKDCSDSKLLPLAIAAFKTPVLRDLGHSSPYMHTGQFDTLQDAVSFYVTGSAMADQLRNGAPELQHINLQQDDVGLLVAFLRALNEDYD
jgi:cytochrome c peroxidase